MHPSDFPQLPFIGMEHVEAHTMRLIGTVPAGTMKSQAVHFFPGDVLYGRLRPYLNKVLRPDFEGLCSAEFIVFPAADGLNGKYLQYLLNSAGFVSFAAHLDEGDRPRVDFGQLSGYLVPLAPLDEQGRIVAETEKQFSRLDAAMVALEGARAKFKQYRGSVMKAACEGLLVPTEAELARAEGRSYETGGQLLARILNERRATWEREQAKRRAPERQPRDDKWKVRYPMPEVLDRSRLPDLPDGWEWCTFDQLLVLLKNGISTPPTQNEGVPVLRISAVRPLSVDLHDVRFLHGDLHDYHDYILSPGDLLFTRYNGNRQLVGVCGLVGTPVRPTVHPDKLIRARVVSDLCSPKFCELAVNSGFSRNHVLLRVRTTAGQSGVSGRDLRTIPIPLPPLAEQYRIVGEFERRLSVVNKLGSVIETNLRRATRLRQTILRRAFEGKLVFQDPNEEPASALLERVRASHAAARPAPQAPFSIEKPEVSSEKTS